MVEKVAVLAPRLYDYGGITRVVKELSAHLSNSEEFEFDILTTRIKGSWHEEMGFKVIKFSPYPYPEFVYRRPDVVNKLEGYDLIWNHNLYLNRLSSKIDKPFISTFHPPHGNFPGVFSEALPMKARFDRYLNSIGVRYLPYADRVVAISDQNKDRLSEHLKAKPVRIYHGADSEYASLSEKDEGFIFCPDTPDKTVKRLARDYEVYSLGDGEDENINYVGSVTDEELHDYYSRCSFVVSGSGKEGFGITPVEAAFHGKPAVVRNIGGHKETVVHRDTGFLAGNSKELHKYVEKLNNDRELRKKLGKEAYKRAQNTFSWERAAEEYLVEFRDLCL